MRYRLQSQPKLPLPLVHICSHASSKSPISSETSRVSPASVSVSSTLKDIWSLLGCVSFKVICKAPKGRRVTRQKTDGSVAAVTKNAPNLLGFMAMVDMHRYRATSQMMQISPVL